jgi:hypothetical protein
MRIAVIGTYGMGQEQFIKDLIKVWPNYSKSEGIHHKVIKDKKLEINEICKQQNQQLIFDAVVDEMMIYKKEDKVIHETCPLENLINILWLIDKDNLFDTKFVEKVMKLTKISLTYLDLIVFLPKLKNYEIVQGTPEEEQYSDEINNLLLAIQETYIKSQSSIFPFDTIEGSPALIEIFGSPEERIQMLKLYLDEKGEPYGKKPEDSLIQLPNLEEQTYIDNLLKQSSK